VFDRAVCLVYDGLMYGLRGDNIQRVMPISTVM